MGNRTATIRRWAQQHGIAVADRGRVAKTIIEQYNAAAAADLNRNSDRPSRAGTQKTADASRVPASTGGTLAENRQLLEYPEYVEVRFLGGVQRIRTKYLLEACEKSIEYEIEEVRKAIDSGVPLLASWDSW
jgi:hypothetical protein